MNATAFAPSVVAIPRTPEPDADEPNRTPLPSALSITNATRVRAVDVIDLNAPAVVLPRIGDTFGGFTIIDELGRGAFGRVFLATEHNLANRLVALKITRRPNRESQKLARLQHTNIVPIHNAFEQDGWYVMQMPFFGRQTLAHLINAIRSEKTFPKVSGEVFASTQMQATTSRKTLSSARSTPLDPLAAPSISPEILAADGERQPARELLVGLSYIDAALWLIARIADGLAHAHGKGILHLDLKPHNVLLSDDGQPMLLDFNLALDLKRMERDRIGGTWPYMSPEQICEYARRPGSVVDARSDLYALGVMAFELLTLQNPFPPVRTSDDGLTAAVAARMAGAPDVRRINPQVPPSIAAVIARLLAPQPIDRYQSADELREDLRRHTENRPLAFAPNRSIHERVVKWHRRNPRMSLLACTIVLGIGLAFSAAQIMAWSEDRQRVDAIARAQAFLGDASGLRLDLGIAHDTERRQSALDKTRHWLSDYHVGDSASWSDSPAIRLLPDSQQQAVRAALAELALLAGHAEWLNSRQISDTTASLAQAEAYRQTAKIAYGSAAPEYLKHQAREFSGERALPATHLSADVADLYARGVRLMADGHYRDATTLFEKLTELAPDHFAGQYNLAICCEQIGHSIRALERYQIAKPLAATDGRPAFRRGLVLLHAGRYADAEAEFSETLKREPGFSTARLHRAMARKAQNKLREAVEDLNAELAEPNGQKIVAYAVRAIVHDMLDDPAAARRDREAIDALEPISDLDYVSRGLRWLPSDPVQAIADFDRALVKNPICLSALQNKAHVYADRLDQPELALAALKMAAQQYPGNMKVQAGLAVVLARLGKRSDAHAAADQALLFGSDPEVTYQAACAYALTASLEPDDLNRAMTLFRQCLREGYRNWAEIENDRDLNNLRSLESFQRAVTAAKELIR